MENLKSKLLEKFKSDEFAKLVGVEFLEFREGYAKAAMTVRRELLNFHGVAHGAAIYALADVAFSVASNSRNIAAVALSMTIHYRRPVAEGSRLIAEAFEESLGRTTGLYRIVVKDHEGKLIAVGQGLVYLKQGTPLVSV